MQKSLNYQWIPTEFTAERFATFIFPLLPSEMRRGPKRKHPWFTIFHYILYFLHTGCQWHKLPIFKGPDGKPEIHYTTVYRSFRRLESAGFFNALFISTVLMLKQADLLDISVVHGDGTTTAAKKGGDNIGYNGHKRIKGDKVVPICDRNCNVIAPFVAVPGNQNESPLLIKELRHLRDIAKSVGLCFSGSIASFDGIYDCPKNRKAIFNFGMKPNIPENKRNRKKPKRGRKALFDPAIFEERFNTIERVFAWEDKFKRLLLRFERISKLHYALKTFAYALINLRHFCSA